MRVIASFSLIAALSLHGWAQEQRTAPNTITELPVDGGQVLDNLPVLIDPKAIPSPPTEGEAPEFPSSAEILSVEQATKKLKLAQQKNARWQKLAQQGVLSTMEVEKTEVEICLAELALRRACWAEAKANTASTPETLKECETACATAEVVLADLRLTLAERNLARYQRLYAARLVPKVQVQRAQEVVARLQAAKTRKPE